MPLPPPRLTPLIAAVICAAGVAQAQPEEPPADELGEVPPAPPAEAPERWFQILASPHIGSRLSALAVDPEDSQHILVGGEDAAVLRSRDGGITWESMPTHARRAQRREVGLPPLDPPSSDDEPTLLHLPKEPFRPSSPFVALFEGFPRTSPWEQWPPFLFRFYVIVPSFTRAPVTLLSDTLQGRGDDTDPVQFMTVCPGLDFPIFAATRSTVLATDDGYTWINVLQHSASGSVQMVYCHPERPNHVVIATREGVYYSTDGLHFELDTTGWPRGSITAIHTDDAGDYLVAAGHQLFRGTPVNGFDRIYPHNEQTETAPWGTIQWIDREGPDIWLATSDGLRRTRDGGRRWENVANNRFSRHDVSQVVLVRDASGGRQVAVLSRVCQEGGGRFARGCGQHEIAWSGDDGETWIPMFQGHTRRSVQQLAYAEGRWLVATAGELWASTQPGTTALAPETRAWARARLERTPPLQAVVDSGLAASVLRAADINDLITRAARRSRIPRVQFTFDLEHSDFSLARATRGGAGGSAVVIDTDRATARTTWFFLVNFRWSIPDSVHYSRESDSTRRRLVQLRSRVAFMLEDAWHERRMHLERLVLGTENLYQAEVLRTRVEALEALMETWARRPLEEM